MSAAAGLSHNCIRLIRPHHTDILKHKSFAYLFLHSLCSLPLCVFRLMDALSIQHTCSPSLVTHIFFNALQLWNLDTGTCAHITTPAHSGSITVLQLFLSQLYTPCLKLTLTHTVFSQA